MTMRRVRLGAFWLCALLLAPGANAIDLTGFWTSPKTSTCRGLTQAGAKFSSKGSFAALAISQSGPAVSAQLGVFPFDGAVYADVRKDVGQGVLVKCTDSFPEILIALRVVSASTFPPDANGVTGRLTMLFLRTDLPGGSGDGPMQCQVVYERTSTANPSAAGCP